MIRLFAAVAVPEALRLRLSLMQGGIPGARWVSQENFHVTLRFIGDVSETVAGDIDGVLAALRAPAFDIRVTGMGSFGRKDAYSVWAGVDGGTGLTHLAAKIETALQRMGLTAETRKFTPHVTLGTLKNASVPKVQEFLEVHAAFDGGTFRADAFGLYSSHASSQGRLYIEERRYGLTG